MKQKERIIILLLASVNFTHILDFMIMMPLGNYLMPAFHISPRQFSWLVGAYPATATLSSFAAAFFVNNYDRKKVLLLAYTGFIGGTIACGLSPSYGLLFAARILTGLFGGLIGAQVMSIVSDIFGYERRGAAMGAVMSSFAVASSLGVTFALYLTNIFSWHAPFILVGILGVLLIPLLIKFVPPMKEHLLQREETKKTFKALHNVIQSREQYLTLVFSCLVMMGHFLIIPFVNPYLEFNKHYSRDLTPMIYLFGGISSFTAALLLGRLSDRIGKLRVFSYSVLFSFIMIWVITHLPLLPFTLVILLFSIWFIVATGRAVTAQAMISNVVPQEQRGSFMSFNSSVQQLGTSLATFVAGFMVTDDKKTHQLFGYEWVGYLSIVILFLGLMLGRYLFTAMDKKEEVPVQIIVNSE